ncbi:MAG: fructosamine kinase family protein [Gammaproteobacteria bacterium]|nr:fructosamine kinase family protein [Gammaproteobacteria bacterium]
MNQWQAISDHISETLNTPFHIQQTVAVGGGDINEAYQVIGNEQQAYFVKLNHVSLEFMFQVEFDSLNELLQAKNFRIPKPICFGVVGSKSYLVLEYITMNTHGNQKKLGRALAQMHQISTSDYGWYQNNVIGSSLQQNNKESDWLTFWREQRLMPQFQMLYDKGHQHQFQAITEQLFVHLDILLGKHQPIASLLHGDLWSGNYAFDHQGQPTIFDPALYYGDREVDRAMTELFGGFSQDFYQAYDEILPLEEGYQQRKIVYNLYHILNHANLFGASYLQQAKNMIDHIIL